MCFTLIFVQDELISVYDDPENNECFIYENGHIPGCGCFVHCSCFSHIYEDFPRYSHAMRPEDITWHIFMKGILLAKQEGPPMNTSCGYPQFLNWFKYDIIGYHSSHDICMLSKYLDVIDRFHSCIEDQESIISNLGSHFFKKMLKKITLKK